MIENNCSVYLMNMIIEEIPYKPVTMWVDFNSATVL